jgi:molybdopterin synthase catalytic subunit
MSLFRFSRTPLTPDLYRIDLLDPGCGGYVSFEGWVRDRNEGRQVQRLEYEGYETLGIKEGDRIIREAMSRFSIDNAQCAHRLGALELGERLSIPGIHGVISSAEAVVGRPLTPVSVAGVARRTTRRTVRRR